MKPNAAFKGLDPAFWAHVRIFSESVGYTVKQKRKKGEPKVPPTVRSIGLAEIIATLQRAKQTTEHVSDAGGNPTDFAKQLMAYFDYRSKTLNDTVQNLLMDFDEAKSLYTELRDKYGAKDSDMPMNKQKGEKKTIAYLTAMVNLVVKANSGGYPCDFDPRGLTAVTKDSMPLRTLARRVDGAFPSKIDPIAIWEIKEYYHTTTFGSRVSGGVYETLLDGFELDELHENEGIRVKHYLVIDAKTTWWKDGRSYLCRMIDMMHMGHVDEVIFGREVAEAFPRLASEWVAEAKARGIKASEVIQVEVGVEVGEAEEQLEADV